MAIRVLLVDDEPMLLRAHRRALRGTCEMETADSAEAALEVLRRGSFDAVVTDYDMPGEDGLWLLEQVRAQHSDIRRILTSAREPPGLEEHLASGLVQVFLPKPASREELLDALEHQGLGPGGS